MDIRIDIYSGLRMTLYIKSKVYLLNIVLESWIICKSHGHHLCGIPFRIRDEGGDVLLRV